MKASITTGYGPPEVLQVKEIQTPVPKENEILIKIYASSVTAGDCELRRFKIPLLFWLPIRFYMGLFKPRKKILGQEFSGVVESTGKSVTKFKKGDKVFGSTEMHLSAHAEYISIPETYPVGMIPDIMNFEEASGVPVGAFNALVFLKRANIKPGQKILIYGSTGSIGTFAVQIAKYFGAEVTAVCREESFKLMESLGVDKMIDYTKGPYWKSGEKYDIVFEVVGKTPYGWGIKALKEKGIYLLANPKMGAKFRGFLTSIMTKIKVSSKTVDYTTEDLILIKKMIEEKKVKPVIDRTFPLEKIQDAHRYVELGTKVGNVIITINQN
ncbi:MAG: NAD(P)-dependent alcohol dehydrogenase [Ignavibacteriales bacterium]|nr:MAG: NAD(P)-dependent alcohol dehydrogenase [Ignavibacteriales bacterium]